MDDDYDGGSYGSGLSGWAWHELGRQSERSSQNTIRTAALVGARLRGERQVNVHALLAENQALRENVQMLAQQVIELNAEVCRRYNELLEMKAWADDVHARWIMERELRQQAEAASLNL